MRVLRLGGKSTDGVTELKMFKKLVNSSREQIKKWRLKRNFGSKIKDKNMVLCHHTSMRLFGHGKAVSKVRERERNRRVVDSISHLDGVHDDFETTHCKGLSLP